MIKIPHELRDIDKDLPLAVHFVLEINAVKTIAGTYRVHAHLRDESFLRMNFAYYRYVQNKVHGFKVLIVHMDNPKAMPSTADCAKALQLWQPRLVELWRNSATKGGHSLTALPVGSGEFR